ncbi:MAG: response regulator [Desulforhopalus sp.]
MKTSALKILLVEDDDLISQLMVQVFELNKFDADYAADSSTALRLAEQNFYNLAILDINLGNENGFDLIARLKQHLPDMEVITMTGDDPQSIEAKIRDMDVLYHLAKPFTIQELISVLTHSATKLQQLAQGT